MIHIPYQARIMMRLVLKRPDPADSHLTIEEFHEPIELVRFNRLFLQADWDFWTRDLSMDWDVWVEHRMADKHTLTPRCRTHVNPYAKERGKLALAAKENEELQATGLQPEFKAVETF